MRRLIFMHLPKTGGTSIHNALRAAVPGDAIFPHRFSHEARQHGHEAHRYSVFSGHYRWGDFDHLPGEAIRFTILRDPVERVLSFYTFCRRHSWAWVRERQLMLPRIAKERGLLGFLRATETEALDGLHGMMARYLAGPLRITARDGEVLHIDMRDERRVSEEEIVETALRNLRSLHVFGDLAEITGVYNTAATAFGLPVVERLPHDNSRTELSAVLERAEEEEVSEEAMEEILRLTRMDRILYAELARR